MLRGACAGVVTKICMYATQREVFYNDARAAKPMRVADVRDVARRWRRCCYENFAPKVNRHQLLENGRAQCFSVVTSYVGPRARFANGSNVKTQAFARYHAVRELHFHCVEGVCSRRVRDFIMKSGSAAGVRDVARRLRRCCCKDVESVVDRVREFFMERAACALRRRAVLRGACAGVVIKICMYATH